MIRYISLGVVLIIILLAIISRKNYSKYKDGENIIFGIAAMFYDLTPLDAVSKIQKLIRHVRVFSGKHLSDHTKEYVIKIYQDLIILVLILSFVLFGLSFIPERKTDTLKITRPEAGQDSGMVEVKLYDKETDNREEMNLEVYPREFTKEEFDKASETAYEFIDSVMLGKNKSLDDVTDDMNLPQKDESGALTIKWSSSDPTIISEEGIINNGEISKPEKILLTAEVKDNNFKSTYEWDVVVKKEENLSSSEKAKATILSIEEENRSEKEIVLPDHIGQTSVERHVKSRDELMSELLGIGILLIGILTYLRVYRLKKEGEKRDASLIDAYFGFVNRLAIHIGAGLTLQDSFRCSVEHEKCKYLKGEVELALNQISSGIPEYKAYSELGKNIGLQEYMRLMSLIGQNLSYGNSNLLKLLDDEIKNNIYLKREHIRKKGEQASEKLLLPTLILLLLVMGLVMYPAFIQM